MKLLLPATVKAGQGLYVNGDDIDILVTYVANPEQPLEDIPNLQHGVRMFPSSRQTALRLG